ncbi:MAG: histidine kinase [Ornithinimicrobium sp.]|uniref:sensor histidine kinase n=1 Tax=Ornithinimicrobium sp. TaxID=1977084 RepID=UPI0026DF8E86|nr:histidine kinase [Ornithinimicrobium sp.]MDO5740229.1 histidine kinase [Ornithinimicrobium sp.]
MAKEQIASGRGWREVGYWARTALLFFAALMLTVPAVGAAEERNRLWEWEGLLGGGADAMQGLSTVVALGAPLLLLLRRRDLANATWGLGFLQLIFPIGPVMAVLLPQAIRRDSRQEAESLSFLYVLGLGVWFLRDCLGTTGASSFVRLLSSPSEVSMESTQRVPLNVFAVSLVFLLMAVTPIAIGFYRRARSELDDTRTEAIVQRDAVGEMEAQLSRQAERELIAREVHDVIGHRLSLLTLHAGGLEVAASDDPQLLESARYVRENAQKAMDDLRSLVAVLREPTARSSADGALAPVAMSLADLARVIDDMAQTGSPVSSTVFLQDAEDATPVLSHSVYRIVQELLTNARKHAPGQLLRLKVAGGPSAGVDIEASNTLADVHLRAPGTGLDGIAERVKMLGGVLEIPKEDGRFVVRVHLPWAQVEEVRADG